MDWTAETYSRIDNPSFEVAQEILLAQYWPISLRLANHRIEGPAALEEAFSRLEKLYNQATTLFGPNHRYSLIGLEGMAICLRGLHRLDEALELHLQALRVAETSLGIYDPSTMTIMHT